MYSFVLQRLLTIKYWQSKYQHPIISKKPPDVWQRITDPIGLNGLEQEACNQKKCQLKKMLVLLTL